MNTDIETQLERWFNKNIEINSTNRLKSKGNNRYYTETDLYSYYITCMSNAGVEEIANIDIFTVWLRSKYNVIDPKVLKNLNDKGHSNNNPLLFIYTPLKKPASSRLFTFLPKSLSGFERFRKKGR